MTATVWVEERLALAVHERMLVLHGGASGVRDIGLLESALARPRQRDLYDAESDLARLAAAYTFGIVRNHPFVDGNKRTGFLIGIFFLEENGTRFTAPEDVSADAVMQLAAGAIDETDYAAFLREHSVAS